MIAAESDKIELVQVIANKKGDKKKGPKQTKPKLEGGLSNPYAQQFALSQKALLLNGGKDETAPEIHNPYKELHGSNISRVLREFGKNTAPLSVIGHFLNYAGNHLL